MCVFVIFLYLLLLHMQRTHLNLFFRAAATLNEHFCPSLTFGENLKMDFWGQNSKLTNKKQLKIQGIKKEISGKN